MSVLLAAGADETIVDSMGRSVTDVIGFCLEDHQKEAVEARAMSSALQRAPAYRALLWRWHSGSGLEAAGAAVARTGSSASSSSKGPRSPLGISVCWPSKSEPVMRPAFR